MTFIVAEPCIGTRDLSCIDVCPVDCIHPTADEAAFEDEQMVYIDPSTCIDCALCVDACPVGAIYADDDLPAEWDIFRIRNARFFDETEHPRDSVRPDQFKT